MYQKGRNGFTEFKTNKLKEKYSIDYNILKKYNPTEPKPSVILIKNDGKEVYYDEKGKKFIYDSIKKDWFC